MIEISTLIYILNNQKAEDNLLVFTDDLNFGLNNELSEYLPEMEAPDYLSENLFKYLNGNN